MNPMHWTCRNTVLTLEGPGFVMGILNVTPDSFSDGGRFSECDQALAHGERMLREGATIIDVGGESTRPGAASVSERDELERVLPVIEALHERHPDALISIDTSKANVAREACRVGASIINDVTGLRGDPAMPAVAAETRAGLVIMHMRGTPRTMQQDPVYNDVLGDISAFLQTQMGVARKAGVLAEQIVLDPGIGFGKTLEHNLHLLRYLESFASLGRPLLLGVSRKSLFARWLGTDLPERLIPTTTVTAMARRKGVLLHRVHDVRANVLALQVAHDMA